jgi:hypothetical protein
MRLSFFVLGLLASCSAAEAPGNKPKQLTTLAATTAPTMPAGPAAASFDDRVSIIQLIANPARYDGKAVWVEGYVTIGLENNKVCMVEKPGSSQDCLWINFYSGGFETDADLERFLAEEARWKKHNGHQLMFKGVFDASDSGHLGSTSGGIHDISDVNDWDELARLNSRK